LPCDSFHIYLDEREREQIGILRGPSRSIGIIIAALAPPRAARMSIGFQNCTPLATKTAVSSSFLTP
jgi:hypothetical protein